MKACVQTFTLWFHNDKYIWASTGIICTNLCLTFSMFSHTSTVIWFFYLSSSNRQNASQCACTYICRLLCRGQCILRPLQPLRIGLCCAHKFVLMIDHFSEFPELTAAWIFGINSAEFYNTKIARGTITLVSACNFEYIVLGQPTTTLQDVLMKCFFRWRLTATVVHYKFNYSVHFCTYIFVECYYLLLPRKLKVFFKNVLHLTHR